MTWPSNSSPSRRAASTCRRVFPAGADGDRDRLFRHRRRAEQRSHRLGDVDVLVSFRRSLPATRRSPAQGARAAAACRSAIDAAIASRKTAWRSKGRRAGPVSRPAEGQSAGDERSRHSQQSDRSSNWRDPDDLQGLRSNAGPVAGTAEGARIRTCSRAYGQQCIVCGTRV